MPVIPSCFWTYPTTADVPAGQVLEFSVVVPPPATGAVPIPLTGSVITWIPPNSATCNQPWVDFNDMLEVLGYGQAQ